MYEVRSRQRNTWQRMTYPLSQAPSPPASASLNSGANGFSDSESKSDDEAAIETSSAGVVASNTHGAAARAYV